MAIQNRKRAIFFPQFLPILSWFLDLTCFRDSGVTCARSKGVPLLKIKMLRPKQYNNIKQTLANERKMSKIEENFATKTLQIHFNDLVHGLQDPVVAASELYSAELVSMSVLEKIHSTIGLSRVDKYIQLLLAVHSLLSTNPSALGRFILIVQNKLHLQDIATSMSDKYQGQPNMKYIAPLSVFRCKMLTSVGIEY